jgi:hypothetical protein
LNDDEFKVCPEKLLTTRLLENLMMEYFGHPIKTIYSEAIQRAHYMTRLNLDRQTGMRKEWMEWMSLKRKYW